MTCFVDTSAFFAVLDADDRNQPRAKAEWTALLKGDHTLFTTNYVLVETLALLQHRLGVESVRAFQEDIYPLLTVAWIDESTHAASMAGVLSARRRRLSVVDCASFVVMRKQGIHDVFAFDPHFSEQGFACHPGEVVSSA